ncbi:uncharacterized protein LACBIDRAFT_302666 [Laccaria bicolor S238N-H82]|uniref:Predicted protein n=1 Tax=Laccaria bicolor (strain S238N-H82 / ATCC MYA-4686) TaxID=486041 RepID=B0DI43_LACBS|nr:uncharacterized protein LACBIDRAFT_302666 [Laccaria bicolor S238N-H82]EDR05844.1 predicted protein [Laccaria bicolor S238N-H82]|eukprot:XP_001883520.1 predicted protein [Laccaria bicolor S238N-H82]
MSLRLCRQRRVASSVEISILRPSGTSWRSPPSDFFTTGRDIPFPHQSWPSVQMASVKLVSLKLCVSPTSRPPAMHSSVSSPPE